MEKNSNRWKELETADIECSVRKKRERKKAMKRKS